MMNPTELLNKIAVDLQRSMRRKVVYLEGKTDVPIFFGLLGVPLPSGSDKDGYLHEDCLVRGLSSDWGSGVQAVQARVELAARTPGYQGQIFGFRDGDGLSLAKLKEQASSGGLYTWPVYCVENLLIKAGWPTKWGSIPDWHQEFLRYRPYVAFKRILSELQKELSALRIPGVASPDPQRPLKTVQEVEKALGDASQVIDEYRVVARFREEVAAFEQALTADLNEAHALLNGKWVLKVVAGERNLSAEQAREIWTNHICSVGGLAEVRQLWQQIRSA